MKFKIAKPKPVPPTKTNTKRASYKYHHNTTPAFADIYPFYTHANLRKGTLRWYPVNNLLLNLRPLQYDCDFRSLAAGWQTCPGPLLSASGLLSVEGRCLQFTREPSSCCAGTHRQLPFTSLLMTSYKNIHASQGKHL